MRILLLLQINASSRIFTDSGFGFKILREQKVGDSLSLINRLIFGSGISSHIGGGLFLGAGADLINITGESIPETKWVDSYVSVLLVQPRKYRFEFALIMSPEVTQIEDDKVFIKGSELNTKVGVDGFLGNLILGLDFMVKKRKQNK